MKKIIVNGYANIYSDSRITFHSDKRIAIASANTDIPDLVCTYVACPVTSTVHLPTKEEIIDAEWVELNERILANA